MSLCSYLGQTTSVDERIVFPDWEVLENVILHELDDIVLFPGISQDNVNNFESIRPFCIAPIFSLYPIFFDLTRVYRKCIEFPNVYQVDCFRCG